MINRRNVLHGMAAGVGVTLGSTVLPDRTRADAGSADGPRRVVFFLQNQGFDPATCVPETLKQSTSLSGVPLPEPISLYQLLDGAITAGEVRREYDERFSNPEFETDWHDALLDLGISALTSGLTNVLTVGSGRGEIFGAWKGLGIRPEGHSLGHMEQPDHPVWVKIRQYNCRMLVKIVTALESMPEGNEQSI